MRLLETNFNGDPNLGLYGFATDSYFFLGISTAKKQFKNTLKVPFHNSTVLETSLAGIFCTGNSTGIVIPKIMEEYEIDKIKKIFDNVLVLKTKYTALGNLIMMNDNGVVLSPLLKSKKENIEKFFDIPCSVSKIAGLNVVGTAGLATNKGCIVHPKIKDTEKKVISKTLGVDIEISTVSFGSPFVKSGIIANSKGVLVSDASSGPEMGKITEALGFL